MLQLEVPLATIEAAVRIANRKGVRVILNPAPAREISSEIFKLLSVITPNEHEAGILTGTQLSEDTGIGEAARALRGLSVRDVVITLGPRGAFFASKDMHGFVPGFDVDAVDSTAAGDVFNGALAVALGEETSLQQAIVFANAAAALSVTKLGAQPSAPDRKEIEMMMKR